MACRLKYCENGIGVVFTFLHVRLVEGVDAENMAGDGRREFPTKKFTAEVVPVFQVQMEDRMLMCAQRLDLPVERDVLFSFETKVYEEPICPICGGREDRFLCHGDNSGAFLTSALG